MYSSKFCDVVYDDERNLVLVTWKEMCRDDEYRNPLLYALEIMQKHPGCSYCADTRSGFENEEADTQWLFDVFLPQAAETSCKKTFFIIDRDHSLKEELEGQAVELRKLFDVYYCFGLEDVQRILGGQEPLSGSR